MKLTLLIDRKATKIQTVLSCHYKSGTCSQVLCNTHHLWHYNAVGCVEKEACLWAGRCYKHCSSYTRADCVHMPTRVFQSAPRLFISGGSASCACVCVSEESTCGKSFSVFSFHRQQNKFYLFKGLWRRKELFFFKSWD